MRSLRQAAFLACLILLTSCGGSPAPKDDPRLAAYRAPAPVPSQAGPYRADTPLGRFGLPPVAPPQDKGMATPAKTVKVGLLLPLSGDNAALGQSLLDAAMLGLFDKYNTLNPAQKRTQVVLLPKDTEGEKDSPELAAKAAIQEGATLLLGPVFTPAVKQAAPVARSAGVPLLAFSNNPELAGKGVYLYGFLPGQQVARVTGEAYAKGLNRIAALVPANAYGKLVAEAFESSAAAHGQKPVAIEYFPAEGDPSVAADRLFADRKGGKPEFDAVLIAEGGDRLRAIAARLKRYNVDNNNTQFLGTGLWDDPALLAAPELAGGWFAGSPVALTTSFDRRFENTYHAKAPRLASLAYDGVVLAVTLAMQTPDTRYPANKLESRTGFAGPANGIFRFTGSGSERGLAVLQLAPRGVREVSPAPRSFGR